MNHKTAILTGAAGFSGAVLTEHLREHGVEVYAVVRPGSEHNRRLSSDDPGLHILELSTEEYASLPERVGKSCDAFYHLLWTGDPYVEGQKKNVRITLQAMEAAKACGCRRFLCTGSQAEYGIVPPDELTDEKRVPMPITPYGAAKTAACHLSRIRAKELGLEWIWGRIFSLIGKYEPKGRMLPDLFCALKHGQEIRLSSCRQNWDYLDVHDAAEAIIALMERGHDGEAYNIAKGDYQPLKNFTEELREILRGGDLIRYGNDPEPFISLQPSAQKLKNDTGWMSKRTFAESIQDYETNDSGGWK